MARLLLLVTATVLLGSCDQLARWRDSQVDTSAQIAKGSQIDAPAEPIELPSRLRRALPLQDGWTILSHHETDGGDSVQALTDQPTGAVVTWLLSRLGELGYEATDNASRILEGTTYLKGSERLFVQVELNTADQTVITLRTQQ